MVLRMHSAGLKLTASTAAAAVKSVEAELAACKTLGIKFSSPDAQTPSTRARTTQHTCLSRVPAPALLEQRPQRTLVNAELALAHDP